MTLSDQSASDPAKLRAALSALKKQQARIDELEAERNEPIAVIGVGCRFPGGVHDPEGFWKLLVAGVDAITEVPADRFGLAEYFDADPEAPGKVSSRSGGFVDQVDRFDARFFGISPREALSMDPQQRLLLEVAWESLEDAGIPPRSLAGSLTGVFVGITVNEYGRLVRASAPEDIDPYFATGNVHNIAAGRLSYFFNFHGPSVALDTACSSSLVSIHLACQSLRGRESSLALAGGVNLILGPEASVAVSKARMLAADGRCKTFDAAADGYSRGEGCGLVVLKRLADAVRDGDRVDAVIRGSAVMQDGARAGLTVPNGLAQKQLIERVLGLAGVAPAEVGYLEAHGTGTALGDPIEVEAAGSVFRRGRRRDCPLVIGSLKTNFGHLESAAGVAGFIKTVLCLRHGQIPAHLHYRTPNPAIDFAEIPAVVPQALMGWPAHYSRRLAAVSSFGSSGTIAHVVLEAAPQVQGARSPLVPRQRFNRVRYWPLAVEAAPAPLTTRPEFGVMFFNGGESADPATNYQLVLDAARFADRSGFSSVWLPERHFTEFGALYPNPATLHAALARETKSVRLMGGSVVLPLHHPLRVVEEWSVVDNLSGGRAGMSFASGWNPDDFVLAPESYAGRHDALFRGIEQVRSLWRGEAVVLPNGSGVSAAVRARPAPLQPELPLWVTAASNPKTFERAGEIGANVLTHLLDQDVDELAEKIALYRAARKKAGHDPAAGKVTLMLHTFLGADVDAVREQVRGHYCRYLRENLHLLGGLAQSRGREFDPRALSETDRDAFITLVYERFFSTRALLGTPESCRNLVERAASVGVGEIACLLDFGPPAAEVMESLPHVHRLLGLFPAERGENPAPRAVRRGVVSPPAQALYRIEWRPVTLEPREDAGSGSPLVLFDAGDIGEAVALRMGEGGRTAVRINRGDAWEPRLPAAGDIVYLWGIGEGGTFEAGALPEILRSLAATGSRARVWIVTRGAQSRPGQPSVVAPGQAALWGLARVIPVEQPDSWGGLIDIAQGIDAGQAADCVARALGQSGREDQILFWPEPFAARLARVSDIPSRSAPLRLDSEAAYLVTGGWGGLGLAAAHWLADRGARRLILIGRSGPGAHAQDIETFAARGVEIHTAALDVADTVALKGFLAQRRRAAGIAIKGVIHAAGCWDDRPLVETYAASLEKVMRPKAGGAESLEAALAEEPLDFFVMFSAFSALLPAGTQGNYAAANAYLDAVALNRRLRGKSALSVNWGPWSEVGFAATEYGRRAHARLESLGIGRLAPAQGFEMLERLMGVDAGQVAVMPVDWARLFRADPAAQLSPLLADFAGAAAPAAPPRMGKASGVGLASVPELLCMLVGFVAASLRIKEDDVDPAAPLPQLGVDSLMAIEIKNRIQAEAGIEVPLAKLIGGESLNEICAFVHGRVQPAVPSLPPLVRIARQPDEPLSFAQQRLWFLGQLDPESRNAYNIRPVLRITGRLQPEVLERALTAIIARHETLRTRFTAVKGVPVQVVERPFPFHVRQVDLSSEPQEKREDEWKRLARDEGLKAFDYAALPLLRALLCRVGPEEHILIFTIHHLVSDGWSSGILIRELAACYGDFAGGKPAALPELAVQYLDTVHWHRSWFRGEVLAANLEFWKARLQGVPVLRLPTDFPRPAAQSYRGSSVTFRLPVDLSGRLEAIAQGEGATLFMLLLSAFQILLGRLTGQEDIAVGSSIANRGHRELEPLIGFLTNVLVMRGDLAGDPTVRELLRRNREFSQEAYLHQELPFEQLVEELKPERDLGYHPLFQVCFALLQAHRDELTLPGLALEVLDEPSPTSRFDLTLTMENTREGLLGNFEFNTDLFEERTIVRFAGYLRHLLDGIAADPGVRLSGLPCQTPADLERVLAAWNDTRSDYPRDKTMADLFEEWAARTPEAVALRVDELRISYRELNARSNRLARYLQSLGVGPEVPVAVLAERSVEAIVSLLAVLKAGGYYVPLDPNDPLERMAAVLDEVQPAAVLTLDRFQDRLPSLFALVLCVDAEQTPFDAESPENPGRRSHPDTLAYVMHTSGSTGVPKGISVTHRGVLRLVSQPNFASFRADDVFVQLAPLNFDASILEIWAGLLNGASVALMPPGPPTLQELGTALRHYAATTLWLPAGLFHLMADERIDDLAGLRQLIAGGDVLAPGSVERILHRLPALQLINGYGPTEGTVFSCCHPCRPGEGLLRGVPIGRPISDTRAYILDRSGNPTPPGAPGELFIGGDGLARGYFLQPGMTAERFVPDPFSLRGGERLYRTGDQARWREDGRVEFIGRIDGQVKLRGFRIELGEIETALRRHPSVADVAVTAREDSPGDKRLVAYIVGVQDAPVNAAVLRLFLATGLPAYMVPSAFVAIERLPLTRNGKVDRRALPAPETGAPEKRERKAPRTESEEAMASIWSEVLGVADMGIEDNFFDMGGHSLLATQIASRVQEVFGAELSLRTLFEKPTIAQIVAELIAAESTPGEIAEMASIQRRLARMTEAEVDAALADASNPLPS